MLNGVGYLEGTGWNGVKPPYPGEPGLLKYRIFFILDREDNLGKALELMRLCLGGVGVIMDVGVGWVGFWQLM